MRSPVLFLGHGNPMNAILETEWSSAWQAWGQSLAEPRAILSISAHWYTRGTFVTSNVEPPTLHDFYGFPQELFEVRYPAHGEVNLARTVANLLARQNAALSETWGLDHGTWSVLRHLRPQADWPVVQLSIDRTLPIRAHLEIGQSLAQLRNDGVLILGSGNITHNLAHAFRNPHEQPDWAEHFDKDIATALEQRDAQFLVQALDSDTGRAAHPSPDHYVPLLYAFGATDDTDPLQFPVTGFDMGSISMRAIQWG